jgi:bacillithiol biosynthesis cysteine-adding enzyme BshC
VLPHSGLSPTASPRADARPGDHATSARFPVDIRRFPWIRRLPADYAFDYERLRDFFAGNPAEPGAWREAIGRTQAFARQPDALASLLEAQQRRRGAPVEALNASAELRDSKTVAILTGQQAGLFGGPLFTLLKALTALRLAERVRTEHGVSAVAVFWIDSEDHDWNEVKTCTVLDRDMASRSLVLGDPPGAHDGPVSDVRLDATVSRAITELESTLAPTEFTTQVLEGLRLAYAPGAGMADAFGRWLEALLGSRGLVVYDASDPAAKPLLADLFAREVEYAGKTSRLAIEAGAALEARGYHAQAAAQEANLALFHLHGGREPMRGDGDGFLVGDRRVSRQELLERVRRSPGDFSPNVLLRPLAQDTIFPTVCYVAGPSELAYLGQLRAVYAAFGIPMPLIQARATATILDSNAMRFLARHDFPLESLRAQDESALNALLESQLPPTVEASLQDAVRAVEERMNALAAEVPQIDPTLEGATRSTLTRMQDDLKKLHNKIIQAAKRRDETLRRQFHHARAQAFPNGQAQERELGLVYFVNRYGPALVDRLADELPTDMGLHWVLTI